MNVQFSVIEKIVGFFTVIIIALLLVIIILIGRGKDWFQSYAVYTTILEQSYGLKKDAVINLYKTAIGKVKKVTIEDNNKVKVKLFILEKYAKKIRTDSVAVVEEPPFVGSTFISIIPGSLKKPAIPPGGVIKGKKAKSISDFLDELNLEKTAQMFVVAVQNFSDIIATLKNPNGPLFTPLNNISLITQEIQMGKGNVGQLLKSDVIINNVIYQLEQVDMIMKNLSKTTAKLPNTIELVESNLKTTKKIGDSIYANTHNLKNFLGNIQKEVDKVKVILNNIQKASYNIPEITSAVQNSLYDVNKLLNSLNNNLIISPFLIKEPQGTSVDAGLR